MKIFFLFLAIISIKTLCQENSELVVEGQLFIGIKNVQSNEVVTHYIDALGKVWEKSNDSFVISNDNSIYSNYNNSVGNYDSSNSNTCAIFNWKWKGILKNWGLGLYKISNSKVSDKYFYLDTRDINYGNTIVNPDIWFYYDINSGKYYSSKKNWFHILNGTVIKVNDILNTSYSTSTLINFWSNSLVIIPDQNNHPKLIWGKYPNDNFNIIQYNIYKNEGSNYSFLASTTNYEYTDLDEYMITGTYQANERNVKYIIKAVKDSDNLETESSNEVSIRIPGEPLSKLLNNKFEEDINLSNYPNPFNPKTSITFNINNPSHVELKIYNSIGKEVECLLSNKLEKGFYKFEFDGSKLTSGIYFYTLLTEEKMFVNKMTLMK